jgi:ABC-type sugar transport system ATPase subunit
MATAERPLLELRRISKSYGRVQALREVELDVQPSEILALVGDNGAGKSTLAKVISGAHRPDEGEIVFDGERREIGSPSDGKQLGIEMVYQNLGLLENLSVAANIFLGRELRRTVAGRRTPFLDLAAMDRRSKELLDAEGARGIPTRRNVAALSGGQRQLVAIARAAGWGQRLIVMDEPTAALGVRESQLVLDLMRDLRARGIAILVISHNLEHVFEIADRIAVLRRGRSVGTVKVSECRPDEVVRLILGADVASPLGARKTAGTEPPQE